MLKILRLYYNYFLVKWDFRKVLPEYFINRIEVDDCGEELVKYQDTWVRKRVAVMLDNAQRALPPHFELKVVSGFRDSYVQRVLQMKFPDSRKIAAESGHATGGHQSYVCETQRHNGSVSENPCGVDRSWRGNPSHSRQRAGATVPRRL